MSHERHTGPNTYFLRLQSGEVLYDPDGRSTGYDTTAAYLWLWQPEHVDERAIEVSKRLKCGRVTAMRAR